MLKTKKRVKPRKVYHSPLPWVVVGEADPEIRSGEATVVNQVCSGAIDNDDTGAANAAFIVKACNNYEQVLLENRALRLALGLANAMLKGVK